MARSGYGKNSITVQADCHKSPVSNIFHHYNITIVNLIITSLGRWYHPVKKQLIIYT